MLRSTLGHQRTLLDAHFYDLDGEDLHGFALVEGHLDAAFFAEHFGADWHANGLTMLREPVARDGVAGAPHPRPARPVPGAAAGARAATRRRCSSACRASRTCRPSTCRGRHRDATDVDAAALAEAKANLDRLAFGVTEQFDSSMALLMERLGFGIPKFDVANVSRGTRDDDLQSDEFRAVAPPAQRSRSPAVRPTGASCCGSASRASRARCSSTPADEKALDGILRFRRQRVEQEIRLPPASVAAARFSGWLLIDGRPADAAFVRVDDEVIPLVPRIERSDAARGTHNLHNRTAGVVGTLRIPPDARQIRARSRSTATGALRAQRTIEIVRVEPAPLTTRLPAAVKNRVGKLLGR